jgi:light-regulated signal transduction histidine kinase (bacteriophytochrome)
MDDRSNRGENRRLRREALRGRERSRSIAEAHGGSLEVDSAPAHGSTFTLELPLG